MAVSFCGKCHVCGARIAAMIDGVERCGGCGREQKAVTHGWGRLSADTFTACEEVPAEPARKDQQMSEQTQDEADRALFPWLRHTDECGALRMAGRGQVEIDAEARIRMTAINAVDRLRETWIQQEKPIREMLAQMLAAGRPTRLSIYVIPAAQPDSPGDFFLMTEAPTALEGADLETANAAVARSLAAYEDAKRQREALERKMGLRPSRDN